MINTLAINRNPTVQRKATKVISLRLAVALCLLLCSFCEASAQQKLTRHVDPFIGTAGHGHTYPGATLPFGMVQLSPDTRLTGWDGCSGYHYSDDIIYGFSHTHLSGTGISDYGDILLMPTLGDVFLTALADGTTEKGYASRFRHATEVARPGFYSVRLDDENILVELTTTKRAGFHRYTFPATDRANVILDLAHRDKVIDSELRIIDDRNFVGWRRSEGWAKDQIVYFAGEFSQPFTARGVPWGITFERRPGPAMREIRSKNIKAHFTFDATRGAPILVRIGISAVSVEGALQNLRAEIPHWDFDRVAADADRAWNAELNKIQISGGSELQRKVFYTALYHSMIAPNLFMDVDGQYRGRDFAAHTAKGFDYYTVFSLWDTFRAAHPLYTIIDQKRTVDFIETFLAQYEQGGRLPVWELAANETDTMIGYHAVPVIADAAIKGIGGFDLGRAFAAMKQSAERKEAGLKAYTAKGFIQTEDERESVSKTLEYAYDDWCIAQVARLLGRQDDYQRYIRRAQFYRNVFDRQSGFMRPRSNGGWLSPFDPREVDFNFTEANSWQYTFFVPQDISGLIGLMGGEQKFARKLDEMFAADSRTTGREQADITGLMGQYAHGNEPSHATAYLYNYAGQPWKTQHRVRQIMDKFYTSQPDGLIGNEDCGQMSAWYVLSAAGFYPVTPGSTVYAIGTPLFPEVRFNLENGKQFVIKAREVSSVNIYIQSATLNGKPYRKSFFTHRDLMTGGELIFKMGPRPNQSWGSAPGDFPVSAIKARPIVPTPVVEAVGKTFKDRQRIGFQTVRTNEIRYTTDGTEPNPGARLFDKPFFIDRTTELKAIAINRAGETSLVATATFHKIPHNWSLKLFSQYSSQYKGGGDPALIDGIRGGTNFTDGAWQGYQGQDLIAVVDLGEVQSISRLGAGFLQDIGSWIWMPRQIDFELSTDGATFTHAVSLKNDVSEREYGAIVKSFTGPVTPRPARYVKMIARSYGKLPAWHLGAGGDSWIFVDEIIVESRR